jgi:hypothetical protein
MVAGNLPPGSTPFETLSGLTLKIIGEELNQSVVDVMSGNHIAFITDVITCTNGKVVLVDSLFPIDHTKVPIADTGALLGKVFFAGVPGL